MSNPYTQVMQPWPDLAPYARIITLPGSELKVFAYDAGLPDAPPVVLVHGLGDEADTWRAILPALAERNRVIALDLPGFGRSDKPGRDYTIPFYRDVLLEVLDALGMQRSTLVGHSMGGMIVHYTALSRPERVERLVLISGSLVASRQRLNLATMLFLVPGLGEWLYNRLRKDPHMAYRSLEPYYHHLSDLPQAERDFLFQRVNERVWSDGQRRSFLSALRNLARWVPGQQRGLAESLRNLETPTSVLWGEADQVNPVANAHALAARQPGVRLEILAGAGHNLHQERPQAVLAGLLGK